jgi:hypothetical protein
MWDSGINNWNILRQRLGYYTKPISQLNYISKIVESVSCRAILGVSPSLTMGHWLWTYRTLSAAKRGSSGSGLIWPQSWRYRDVQTPSFLVSRSRLSLVSVDPIALPHVPIHKYCISGWVLVVCIWYLIHKLNVAQADLAWFDLSLDDTEMSKHLPFLYPDLDVRPAKIVESVSCRAILGVSPSLTMGHWLWTYRICPFMWDSGINNWNILRQRLGYYTKPISQLNYILVESVSCRAILGVSPSLTMGHWLWTYRTLSAGLIQLSWQGVHPATVSISDGYVPLCETQV